MRKLRNWSWLFLFGSLWGINEVVVGSALSQNNIPYASVLLAAYAFLILAIARGILNKPGSSTAIGVFAALFKLSNTVPFYCHLLGIFMIGLTFDVFSSLLMKDERKVSFKCSLTGVLSAYANNALFAVVMTYIVRYEFWAVGGSLKLLDHIFAGGSFTALLAGVVVPLGFWTGVSGGALIGCRPKWTYAVTLVGIGFLWTLARVVG